MKPLALTIAALGFAYYGFEHDSGWAFVGSIISLLSLTDCQERL